jgi:hypothetical protein
MARALRLGGAVSLDGRPNGSRFDLRYRALTLARLEIESDGWLNVTLLDEAYRSHVFHWLGDHLDASARAIGPALQAAREPSALPAPGQWAEWARTPHVSLGGETPLEAGAHDFGRRRLTAVLSSLSINDDELTALRQHLGL